MMQRQPVCWVLSMALLGALAACDLTDNSPKFPDVAGTYEGEYSIQLDDGDESSNEMRLRIDQSGSEVSISGTFHFGSGEYSVADMTGDIDENGVFDTSSRGLFEGVFREDTECGNVRVSGFYMEFSGNRLDWQERVSFTECFDFRLSATLRKD